MSEKKQPIAEIYDKGVKATIWENSNENGPLFSTKLCRVYKDKETGKYKETSYLSGTDLLVAREVAGEAYRVERKLVREYNQAMSREPAEQNTQTAPEPAPRQQQRRGRQYQR